MNNESKIASTTEILRATAALLRGLTYDGRRAGLVRFLGDAPTDADAQTLELSTPSLGDGESTVDLADDYIGAAARAWNTFVEEHRNVPKRIAVDSVGGFEIVPSQALEPEADTNTDAIAPARQHTMVGRVAVITGGAQGFGLALAEQLLAGGAWVVLVDMNLEGAEASAEQLNTRFGPGRAAAVACNVADESSVQEMMTEVSRRYGGFDIFLSNAGVLRAGSVMSLSHKDFGLVTDVNYSAFFLCTKHAAPVLKLQDAAYRARLAALGGAGEGGSGKDESGNSGLRAAPTHYASDIIQINSKSGLIGSNKNGAYAGSKFGGIGLVQSFALELVEFGIKVNAICPGNFFDGPLWSDPDRGLFVQYLQAGKVPGAESIADVKRHYEQRVPMGRGCTGADVARAVYYIVDQVYETGQAVPVTGGQEMLR